MIRSPSLAHSVTIVVAVTYTVCVALTYIAPTLLLTVIRSWVHSVNVYADPAGSVPLTTALLGLVSLSAVTWVWTYAASALYNYFAMRVETEEKAVVHGMAAAHPAR
jgi:hypothetical protein